MLALVRSGSTRYDSAVLETEWGWGYLANHKGKDTPWPKPNPRWGIDAVTGPDDVLPLRAGENWPRRIPRTIRGSDVAAPSRMIAQGDASRFIMESGDTTHLFLVGVQTFHDFQGHVSSRHSGKVVVLFADGHAGSETYRQLFYPSLENWTRFNYDNKKHWR